MLKDGGITDKREFALCMGSNGGKFTIGGYDESLQANPDERVEWFPFITPINHYKIQMNKMKVGHIEIPNPPSRAFIDSGTTFAYLSQSQKKAVDRAIVQLCNSEYQCAGVRKQDYCWQFDTRNKSLKEYFISFPVLSIIATEHGAIKWYPSEYFYEERPNLYCLAIDPYGSQTEMIIGGSMMRQNNFIFDLEEKKLGVVRAKCSEDENMIDHWKNMLGESRSKYLLRIHILTSVSRRGTRARIMERRTITPTTDYKLVQDSDVLLVACHMYHWVYSNGCQGHQAYG